MSHGHEYSYQLYNTIGILPDPLTDVLRAEVVVDDSICAHLLNGAGRQSLVRHGFLPPRVVMTGIALDFAENINNPRPEYQCSKWFCTDDYITPAFSMKESSVQDAVIYLSNFSVCYRVAHAKHLFL